MPTLKNVIYKFLKKRCAPLAEWYNEYRIERPCTNDSCHQVNQVVEEDIRFWEEELNLLHVDLRKKETALAELHRRWNRYTYPELFEETILPLLLEHWIIRR